MNKKIILNIVLLLTTYVVPLYTLHQYRNDYQKIDLRQYTVFFILLIGSVLLTYFNNKYRRQEKGRKWLWVTFELVGIFGLLFSILVLCLLFSLRNCCGF